MFQLGAGEVMKLALRCRLKINGPSLDSRARRVYSSLPQPLRIRFTWADSDQRQASIEVSAVNPPPQLRSRASVEKSAEKPVVFWGSVRRHCG